MTPINTLVFFSKINGGYKVVKNEIIKEVF